MTKPSRLPPGNGSLLTGEGLSRRRFLGVAAGGVLVSTFGRMAGVPLGVLRAPGVALRGTARNCVFLFLQGGPSHVDLWDLKEGPATPLDFAPASYGDVRFPQGLLPATAEHVDKLAFVRSGRAWALVHPLAQTWSQIARNPIAALGSIAPHIGSVVALERESSRAPSDVLPTFVALHSGWVNVASTVGSGYLPARFSPLTIARPSGEGLTGVVHPDGADRLRERWGLISRLDAARQDDSLGRKPADMAAFTRQAIDLANAPDVGDLFRLSGDERERYGSSYLGDALAVARKVLAAGRGAQFIQVAHDGWDNHGHIYSKVETPSLRSQCAEFDPAFGAFLHDLAADSGHAPGKSLLDETLVVVFGEFGRTVGPLNGMEGRDHFLRMSVVFAGAGVRGGRALGRTDEKGADLVDSGWAEERDVRPEDVAATVYSALGIDYTTVRHDDPLGRGFEYVPFAKDGVYRAVDELWKP